MKYIIILIILYIIFSPKKKNYIRKRKRKNIKKSRTVLKTEIVNNSMSVNDTNIEYRRFMAQNLPELLQTYNVFYPCYFTRLAERVLLDGTIERYRNDEILPDATPEQAFAAFYEASRILSSRYNNLQTLKNATKSKAKYVTLKVDKGNPNCPRVPSEHKYKIKDEIPVFPCLDCKEDPQCNIWYKIDF